MGYSGFPNNGHADAGTGLARYLTSTNRRRPASDDSICEHAVRPTSFPGLRLFWPLLLLDLAGAGSACTTRLVVSLFSARGRAITGPGETPRRHPALASPPSPARRCPRTRVAFPSTRRAGHRPLRQLRVRRIGASRRAALRRRRHECERVARHTPECAARPMRGSPDGLTPICLRPFNETGSCGASVALPRSTRADRWSSPPYCRSGRA
jgi:hypothetical protein